MSLTVGEILKERYRIETLLGEGGFGAVYRAWNINLNGPCAVKESFDVSPEALSQFSREASMLFNMRHPNLPRVFDSFNIPGQGSYLVMDFIEGDDLAHIMKDAGGMLSEAQAMPWIIQVCDALTYLHAQNPPIIHRDIKPANIRITPQGQAMLVDFGIAKMFDADMKTTTGARAVTPGFSPPEQYGEGSTDAKSDIYALGATLYAVLTGVHPPDSVSLLTGSKQPPLPASRQNPAISPAVSAAIEHAMKLNKAERFNNAAEFKAALVNASMVTAQPDTQPMATAAVAAASAVTPATVPGQPASQPVSPAAAVPPAPPKSKSKLPWIAAAAVVVILVVCVAIVGLGGIGASLSGNGSNSGSTQASNAQPTSAAPVVKPTLVNPTKTAQVTKPVQAQPTQVQPTQAQPTKIPPTDAPAGTKPPASTQPSVYSTQVVDDFSNPSSGWYITDTTEYTARYTDPPGYEILIKKPTFWTWSYRTGKISDVTISATGYLASQKGSYLGLVCRYQDQNNFYGASVSQDSYNIGKMSNGKWIDLTEQAWMPLGYPIADPSGGFDITLSCLGDELTLTLNQTALPAVTDSDLPQGGLGVMAGAGDQAINGYYAEATFENFKAVTP